MFRLKLLPCGLPSTLLVLMLIFILPVVLITFIFWIWMLVDCIKSNLKGVNKLIWVLIILFFPFVGALIYLLAVKLNEGYKGFELKIKTNKHIKRLYRSKKNRIIAGVCGGIGEYFNIDPTIIRLLWVLFTLLGGSGIIAYIVAWIIIPEQR